MASTITNVTQTLTDERIVAAIRSIVPALNAFSYGVEAGALYGDKVRVPVSTDPTVGDKTLGTSGTATGAVATTEVELDNKKVSAWDAVEGEIAGRLFDNYWADKAAGAVRALGKNVVDAALALVTATNYGNTENTDKVTRALADVDQRTLAALWEAALLKIEDQEMSFGMGAGLASALFGESNLALIFSNVGTNFFATGNVPQLLGMSTWLYPKFPNNSEGLKGAMFGKAAIGVGLATAEILADGGEGDTVERRIVTDPESGVQVLYTSKFSGGGTLHGEMWLMYGVKKIQDAVVRLVVE